MKHAQGFHGYQAPTPQSASGNHNSSSNNECLVREQDRLMPIANVIRIMRKILPSHAKISDDSKETIQECVSEFISFVTSEANDRCQHEQRKTITAEDILWAMNKLGFDDYIEPLTVYLHRYREIDGGDRGSVRAEPQPKRFGIVDVYQVGHRLLRPATIAGFMKDSPNTSPSSAGFEPYARRHE